MKLRYLHPFATSVCMAIAFAGATHAADGKETATTFDIRWGDQPVSSLRTQVAPSIPTRWCGTLRKGEAVSWEFNSAEPLQLAVQAQDGRNAVNLAKLDGVTDATGTLAIDIDQPYCWIWTNRTPSPVALQARLIKTAAR